MLDKKNTNSNPNSIAKKSILMKKNSILDVRHFLRQYNIDLEKYDFEKFTKLLQIEPASRNEPIKITIASYLEESNLIELLKKDKSQDINFQNLLYSISESLSLVQLKRDEILFRINDTADNFFIILKGRISVLKPIKKMKQSSFKNYYNFLINLNETNEAYLLKLNLKANSDIFFASAEEFESYQNTLKKMKINEKLYNSSVNKENLIDTIKKEIDFESNIYNINEESLLRMKTQDPDKFLINVRKVFEQSPDENEIYTKYNLLINFCIERKNFIFYEYENFAELRTKQFFGDFALDAADKKRTATIMACEETILGCIPADIYNKHIQAEKIRYRIKDITLLNNFIVFKHIKQIHFERNYFQDFAPFDSEKDQIIFKQGEIIDKLYIIKSGSIDLYLNANLVEINLLIKNLIVKAKSKGIFLGSKANQLLDNLYDGLNVTNKSTSYFDNLVKKKNFLLLTCFPSEAPGIESLMLGIPFLFKGVIKSDRCKMFKLDSEKLNNILKSYQECKKEYMELVETKVDNILSRLFNIKKCLVSRYSIEYELQSKFDRMKIDDQLRKMEAAANQNEENLVNAGSANFHEVNFSSEMQKTMKDFGGTVSTFSDRNNNFGINVENDGNAINNCRKSLNKEALEDLITDIRPYKSFYRKKKPQPDKIKINFQELSEQKLSSNQNLIDVQSYKTKYGNGFDNTKNEFFNLKNSFEANQSLLNSQEKIKENTKIFNSDLNSKNKNLFTLEEKDEKSTSNKRLNHLNIENLTSSCIRTPSKLENNTSKSKASKSRKGSKFLDRKMSYLEFPINKIRSIATEKKINSLMISNDKDELNEDSKSEGSKITEEDNTNGNLSPKKIVEFSLKEELVSTNIPPIEDKNYKKDSMNSQHFVPSNNNHCNVHEEKFKFTTDLSKNHLNTNNSNNNNITSLFRELTKHSSGNKQKTNFFVALNDLDAAPSSQKHLVFNFSHNDYYKNMMKFKVRNDVNQLINSKNEKEMFKQLINSGSQSNFYSVAANKKAKEEDGSFIDSGSLFYNQSSKDMRKNLKFNVKRPSIELQFQPAINRKTPYHTNVNFKKNIFINSSDTFTNNKKNGFDYIMKKNDLNNLNHNDVYNKNFNKSNIKQLILSSADKKLDDFEFNAKNASDFKAFSTRRFSLEKLSHNLKALKHNNLLNSNPSIRNSVISPSESDNNININNKLGLNKSKNRSQGSSPDRLIFYNTNKTPFIKKESASIRKITNNGFNNTNSFMNRNVGYLCNLRDNKLKKKANSKNLFLKKNENEHDCMRETNYFDKQSNLNSTSNGFSTSEKNFRTTLESYMPRKNNNNNQLQEKEDTHVQVTKNDLPENNHSNYYESYDEKENSKGKKYELKVSHYQSKLKSISIEENKIYDKENEPPQIVISEEFSKENDPIKSVNSKNKKRKSTTRNININNNYNLNAINDSELKSIAQQTNENETEILNEKNSIFFNDRSMKQNCLFSSEEFRKNKIHYKNYNDEITLPLYKDYEKNNVKKIREFRSQLILKMTKKGLKNK